MIYSDAELWLGFVLLAVWAASAVLAGCPAGRRWVAGRGWRPAPALVGTGLASGLFTAQAAVVDSVADRGPLARLDGPVLDSFVAVRAGPATTVMEKASALGGSAGMWTVAVVVAVGLWWAGRRREAISVLIASAGAELLVSGFKHLYGRLRPPQSVQLTPESSYSLPSGHSLVSIVVLGILAAVSWRLTRSIVLRVSAAVVATGLVALIGVSRLYLGVHWLTDVLTGWLLGAAWLALCVTGLGLHPGTGTPQQAPGRPPQASAPSARARSCPHPTTTGPDRVR